MFLLTNPLIFGLLLALFPLTIHPDYAAAEKIQRIETFDYKEMPSHIGAWEHHVLDSEQSIRIELVNEDAANKKDGGALAIHFDVDSPNPAIVGCWIKLQNQNLSGFDALHFSLRSGGGERFRGSVAVQFTDEGNRKASYLVSGIKREWKEYRVPLKKFPRIRDWTKVKEFELIIDDTNAVPKEGTLLIDEIYVSGEVL